MLNRNTPVSRVAAVVVTILAAIHTTAALAQGPAEDTLRQIIEEGNPAYLDWSTALADREFIGRLYAANGYRLLWSDGDKPSTAALVLLQELRHASDRGLDPEDYPGNRLAYLLIDLIDSGHPGVEQWALFDASLSLAALRFLSDLHYGRIDPASVGHNLTVERIRLDIPTTLAHLATAVNVGIAIDSLEPWNLSRRAPCGCGRSPVRTTPWGWSSSCFRTPTTSTFIRRRLEACSPNHAGISVMAACASAIPRVSRSTYCAIHPNGRARKFKPRWTARVR